MKDNGELCTVVEIEDLDISASAASATCAECGIIAVLNNVEFRYTEQRYCADC
jgi:hypothetical protein